MPGPESPFIPTDPEVAPERLTESVVELTDGSATDDITPIQARIQGAGRAVFRSVPAPTGRVPGAELSPKRSQELQDRLAEINRAETGPGRYR